MLRERFKSELQEAMKSKNSIKVSTLRLILAAVKDRDLDARSKGNDAVIPDSNILEILSKMVKQRTETISIYIKAGRDDLADQEDQEIKIISEFLPQKLTQVEINKIIEDSIKKTGAKNIRDLGKVISEIKNNYAGRCDLAEISNNLRMRLGG